MFGGKIVIDPTYRDGARFLISMPKSPEDVREDQI